MSYHILHLLSQNLHVNLRRDQLCISQKDSSEKNSVPLEDIAVVISASPTVQFSSSILRRMAELNVVLLVCNRKFEPCSISFPYHHVTNTTLVRKQTECPEEWKRVAWQQLIECKIRNQGEVLRNIEQFELANRFENIAKDCGADGQENNQTVNLSKISINHREGLHSKDANACESRAARLYWKPYLETASSLCESEEYKRDQGTRNGINGKLDYGYAILRSAIVRSLAAHGFIAAIGISHATRAGTFALADDIIEPFRPFQDLHLINFLQQGGREMKDWAKLAAEILTKEVKIKNQSIRLLNVIDLTVRSLATAIVQTGETPQLCIPMLKDLSSEA